MAMVIIIQKRDVLDKSEGLWLAWVWTEPSMIINCAFALACQVICIAVVKVVRAEVVPHAHRTIKRGPHLSTLVSINRSHLRTLPS